MHSSFLVALLIGSLFIWAGRAHSQVRMQILGRNTAAVWVWLFTFEVLFAAGPFVGVLGRLDVALLWAVAGAICAFVGRFVAQNETTEHTRRLKTLSVDEEQILAQQRLALRKLDTIREEAPGIARLLDRRAASVDQIRKRVERARAHA